jgi:hypothetical protein
MLLARMGRWDDGGADVLRLTALLAALLWGMLLIVSNDPWGLALLVPSIAAAAYGALYWALQWTDVGRAASVWRLQPLYRNAQGHLAERPVQQIPTKIKERAFRASKLPGVRLLIWYVYDDPLIVAASGYGPCTEYVVIGAYGTGNPELDNF